MRGLKVIPPTYPIFFSRWVIKIIDPITLDPITKPFQRDIYISVTPGHGGLHLCFMLHHGHRPLWLLWLASLPGESRCAVDRMPERGEGFLSPVFGVKWFFEGWSNIVFSHVYIYIYIRIDYQSYHISLLFGILQFTQRCSQGSLAWIWSDFYPCPTHIVRLRLSTILHFYLLLVTCLARICVRYYDQRAEQMELSQDVLEACALGDTFSSRGLGRLAVWTPLGPSPSCCVCDRKVRRERKRSSCWTMSTTRCERAQCVHFRH